MYVCMYVCMHACMHACMIYIYIDSYIHCMTGASPISEVPEETPERRGCMFTISYPEARPTRVIVADFSRIEHKSKMKAEYWVETRT